MPLAVGLAWPEHNGDNFGDNEDFDDKDEGDSDGDDDGLPAYYHQSHSHLVGICRNDEGWECDTVRFPPYTYIMMNIHDEGAGSD